MNSGTAPFHSGQTSVFISYVTDIKNVSMEKTREIVHMCSVKAEVGCIMCFGIKRIKLGSKFDQKTKKEKSGHLIVI